MPNTFNAAAVRDSLVFVRVSAHGWGVQRKLKPGEYETEAAVELTAASKKLTTDARFKAIRQVVRAVDKWLEDRESPIGATFGLGVHALSVELIDAVVERLEQGKRDYDIAVAEFIRAIPEIKLKAQRSKNEGGLGRLYKERDWPTSADIASRFSFDWSIFDQRTPEQRPGLSSSVLEQEERKLRQRWEDAAQQIETGLYTELAGLVGRLTERLGDDAETGKARIFHASTVEKLRGFLELLGARNVTGSERLGAVADQCSKLLDGVDAQVIRDSDSLRGILREGFTAINSELVESSSVGNRKFGFNKASGF